ncbi:MAG: DUF6717 family protein [Pirellulales bacterium]
MNSLLVIHPYKVGGVWVFDDPRVGLVQEPFVAGADIILDRMVEGIPNAESGVTIFFSAGPFPGSQHEFHWRRGESGGNWYFSPQFDLEGWLCPALFKYFDEAPQRLYAQVKAKSA